MNTETSGQFSLLPFIEDVRKYLPIQFPLGIFIHNNMLLSLEHLQFEVALDEATKIYGAKRTLNPKYYLKKFKEKRISEFYLKEGIKKWLKNNPGIFKSNSELAVDLFLRLLINPLELHLDEDYKEVFDLTQAEKSWSTWEESAKFASAVHDKFKKMSINQRKIKKRKIWKDFLNLNHGERVNDHFHPVLIRFLACYLDQGMALIPNPNKDSGILKDFLEYLYDNSKFLPEGLFLSKSEFLEHYSLSPEQFVLNQIEMIKKLEVPLLDCYGNDQSIEEYLRLSLLELRGWAGMINKFEKEPSLVPRENSKVTVLEYLGIYLLLECRSYAYFSKKYKLSRGWLSKSFVVNQSSINMSEKQLTYIANQMSDLFPDFLYKKNDYKEQVLEQVLKFDKTERAIIWQNAFDLSLRDSYINAVQFARMQTNEKNEKTTCAQFIFCIDDREESIRRHLEETNKNIKTYGVVGFFGVDMKFKSIYHPHPLSHCPPVVVPSRLIYEKIVDSIQNKEKTFGKVNKIIAEIAFVLFYKNRASWYSIFLAFLLAPLLGLGLILRIFKPLWADKLNDFLKNKMVGKIETQLELSRSKDENGQEIGYDFEERALIVSNILKMAGIVDNFSPYVFMVAHGAKSVNNPYRNAYGCGACSGRAGFPNSKIFCKMANELIVQNILSDKYNINIPKTTFFVSSYHDTTTDQLSFLNEDEIPDQMFNGYKILKEDFIKSAKLNAFERTRLFEDKIFISTEKKAYEHVQARASNMAEPRPEYGHTNNLGCFVGRRETIKELFLDRRSFLASYDPTTDLEGKILDMLLGGVIPVVEGINMDYYLSRIDNEKFGSGTKLPLNVTALLGVMTGGCSDLRIGLSKQMVEKHEPVRNTVILEASLENVKRLIVKSPRIKNIVYNNWIHLVVFDYREIDHYYILEDGEFVKKTVDASLMDEFPREKRSSIDVVKNRLDHIPFYFKDLKKSQESVL